MSQVSIPYQIQLDDLDFMGIVSHYKWIQLFERFRTKVYKSRFKELVSNDLGVVIADLQVKYKRPAVYDQSITVELSVVEKKASSIVVRHRALCDQSRELVVADIRLVCIDSTKRAVQMPEYFAKD